MTSAQQPRLTDPRSFAFLLVGTPLPILVALATKSWAAGRGETISVGPSGADVCFAGACKSASFQELGMGGDVGVLAVLSILAGIAAMAVAGLYGGLVLAKKEDKLPPIVAAHAAFGAAAFAMFLFALRVGGGDEVSLSWGPLFGLGGVGIGWYLVRRLQKTLPARSAFPRVAAQPVGAMFGSEPAASSTASPAAASAVAPAAAAGAASSAPASQPTICPKCKGAVEYIAQYQRSWCARCRQYA